MRLLLYGFGPYGRFRENITERILKRLRVGQGTKKIVFPVRFQKKQFLEALEKYRPDVILGLGQTSRSGRIKIEQQAVNRRRRGRGEKARAIVSGGPRRLPTTLDLKRAPRTEFSRDAGDYVCNYSMYLILDYLRRRRLPTRFGFIHIPHDYPVNRARSLFKKIVKEVERA